MIRAISFKDVDVFLMIFVESSKIVVESPKILIESMISSRYLWPCVQIAGVPLGLDCSRRHIHEHSPGSRCKR